MRKNIVTDFGELSKDDINRIEGWDNELSDSLMEFYLNYLFQDDEKVKFNLIIIKLLDNGTT
jgi:hypothetical protein